MTDTNERCEITEQIIRDTTPYKDGVPLLHYIFYPLVIMPMLLMVLLTPFFIILRAAGKAISDDWKYGGTTNTNRRQVPEGD